MKVTIRSVHKYNPSFRDVTGPFDATPEDFRDLESARRWFKRHRITLGRATMRREGNRIVFFPASRMASSPHSIIVTPGSSLRLRGREIEAMAHALKMKGYSQPMLYARKLYREGVRLEGRWTDEGTAEGYKKEGGLTRRGMRYVNGVKERLYGSRGGPGSLEQTHGFRDASGGRDRNFPSHFGKERTRREIRDRIRWERRQAQSLRRRGKPGDRAIAEGHMNAARAYERLLRSKGWA